MGRRDVVLLQLLGAAGPRRAEACAVLVLVGGCAVLGFLCSLLVLAPLHAPDIPTIVPGGVISAVGGLMLVSSSRSMPPRGMRIPRKTGSGAGGWPLHRRPTQAVLDTDEASKQKPDRLDPV